MYIKTITKTISKQNIIGDNIQLLKKEMIKKVPKVFIYPSYGFLPFKAYD